MQICLAFTGVVARVIVYGSILSITACHFEVPGGIAGQTPVDGASDDTRASAGDALDADGALEDAGDSAIRTLLDAADAASDALAPDASRDAPLLDAASVDGALDLVVDAASADLVVADLVVVPVVVAVRMLVLERSWVCA